MIPEFPNLPTKLQPEDRFIFALKNRLREHAQEINRWAKQAGDGNVKFVTLEQFNALKKIVDAMNREQIENPEWTKRFTIKDGKLCQIIGGQNE